MCELRDVVGGEAGDRCVRVSDLGEVLQHGWLLPDGLGQLCDGLAVLELHREEDVGTLSVVGVELLDTIRARQAQP